jgi:redox-sensitive bicupin YhaK (pirin superfamily)
MHGVQFWVAQPDATRHGAPAFEHHAALPELGLGPMSATVLLGSHEGSTSPARTDWPAIGLEQLLRPGAVEVPLDPTFEHAVVVLEGALQVGDTVLEPGRLGYLEPGRTELALRATGDGRALLLGGTPFESKVLMWWNFVARTRDEVDAAATEWNDGSDRFGEVTSDLERIPSPVPPWRTPSRHR